MENKINIAELLKDCPEGMELDCTMYENVTLGYVFDSGPYPIKIKTPDGLASLDKYGCYSSNKHAKCVIFPKGKTTWEGFVHPCQFKDGDIVATNTGTWIGITEGGKKGCFIPTYCAIKSNDKFEAYFDIKESWAFGRHATEEEKEKLFKAIKDNGYQWNAETKTLEKLVEPKFKYGDWVVQGCNILKIRRISNKYYGIETVLGHLDNMLISEIDSLYHLWTIQDAKDGDILAFDDETIVIFKDLYNKTSFHSYCHIDEGIFTISKEDIPDWWEGQEFYPATKEQRALLFQKIKEAGYEWDEETKTLEKLSKSYEEETTNKAIFDCNAQCCDITNNLIKKENKTLEEVIKPRFRVGNKIRLKSKHNCIYTVFCLTWDNEKLAYKLLPNNDKHLILVSLNRQDEYELVSSKFDINTLKPFDKVLVRDKSNEVWTANFYSHYDATSDKPFICVGWSEMNEYRYCIPYEVNNELLGTTNNTEEYGSR